MPPTTPRPAPGIPDRSTVSNRASAPASEGLPPSHRTLPATTKQRRRHPPTPKQGALQSTEALIAAADMVVRAEAALMPAPTPTEACIAAGVEATSKSVREMIRDARARFASRAAFYVEMHAEAAAMAAARGDARPAEWALERIADGDARVVDSVKQAPVQAPAAVNIGIVLGGVGQSQPVVRQLPAEDSDVLPPVTTAAAVTAELMP